MANNNKTFERYNTIVQIAEIDKGKYMLSGIINKAQLSSLYKMFEPLILKSSETIKQAENSFSADSR